MKTKRKDPATGVRFDLNTRRWLVEHANAQDLTVSQVVRKAVAEYRVRLGEDAARKGGV